MRVVRRIRLPHPLPEVFMAHWRCPDDPHRGHEESEVLAIAAMFTLWAALFHFSFQGDAGLDVRLFNGFDI